MTILNRGDLPWRSQPGSSVVLYDDADVAYRPMPRLVRAQAGRVMPAVLRVAPGRTVRRLVVFEVPQGATFRRLRLTVGTGADETVLWKVG